MKCELTFYILEKTIEFAQHINKMTHMFRALRLCVKMQCQINLCNCYWLNMIIQSNVGSVGSPGVMINSQDLVQLIVIFQLLGFSLVVKRQTFMYKKKRRQTLDLEVLNFEHCQYHQRQIRSNSTPFRKSTFVDIFFLLKINSL